MKVSKALRDTFNAAQDRYLRLSAEVRDLLFSQLEERRWFHTSRVKELESFALKVETGRVPDPSQLEDFFGFTIIVPTLGDITAAEIMVSELFDVFERRPPADDRTSKLSSDFRFDDLRLYVCRRPLASGKNPDLDGAKFEIQIKTILQHAWSIATHDLIYKTDTVSWPKERIAYQVKAMLEHAEIAISEATRLADSPGVAKKNDRTTDILRLIEQIEQVWPGEALPANRKRLAENVLDVLKAADLQPDRLIDLIDAERRRIGILPSNLSPYSFVVQALLNSTVADFRAKFSRRNIRTVIVIQDGMEVPPWVEGFDRVVDLRKIAPQE
jgi:ppGpp synthetase/RelA/SpoT-type nucleotidyltranferase